MDEVRCARLNVERETAADVEAIRERLRAAESLKMAALQQAGADVRAEVEASSRRATTATTTTNTTTTNTTTTTTTTTMNTTKTIQNTNYLPLPRRRSTG